MSHVDSAERVHGDNFGEAGWYCRPIRPQDEDGFKGKESFNMRMHGYWHNNWEIFQAPGDKVSLGHPLFARARATT
jgi:hypothetical protein